MGRVAGVTAEETREKLLAAAAAAFESQGFEGTRVADIAGGAGVSNGALYSHFGSKTELLAAALHHKGHDELAALFLAEADNDALDLLAFLGGELVDRPVGDGALVIEALVAARRNPELALLMGDHLRERDGWLTDLIAAGQADGTIEAGLSPEIVSRFCLMLMLGSVLLPVAGLDPVDPGEWTSFITRLADALRPAEAGRHAGEPTDGSAATTLDLTRGTQSPVTPGLTA